MHHQKVLRFIGMLAVLLLLPVAGSTADELKTITPEMVVSLKSVSSVQIQPQGSYVAYVRYVPRAADEKPGSRYSEIWIVPSVGGEPRQFTTSPGTASSPRWSPDGKKIAFLSKREGKKENQVYVIPIDGGEAKLVTNSETSISQFEWSPDGKRIAYRAKDPKSKEEEKEKDAGKDWEVVEKNLKHHRLWVVDVATGKKHKVISSALTVWNFDWSPDGKKFLVAASSTPLTDASYMFKHLYTVSAEGGEPEMLCNTDGKLGTMDWSPNGKTIAFLGGVDASDASTGSIFVVPANGGEAKNITPDFNGTASWLGWTDNNNIAFTAIDGTKTTLNSISGKGGIIKQIISNDKVFYRASFSKDGSRLAVSGSTELHPYEAFFGTVKDKTLRRLTNSNPELEGVSLLKQEVIRWKASDGMEIEGLLMKPLNYEKGKRYPLIVQVHGGPESAYTDGWNTSYGRWTQLLAARGYMVLMPNYRGSTGRGVAYAKADHKDLAGKEFQDVLDGIDYLDEQGLVDSKRVGIGGGSYGGYFSAWAATAHSERFAAAVDFAGISNWHSMNGVSDIPYENSMVHWNLMCWDEQELCWDRSPMSKIGNARTPTLIAHGEKDLRVPVGQGWELFTGLKIKGITNEFVIYPREPHGLRERAHQLDFINRALGWYDRYVKGEKK